MIDACWVAVKYMWCKRVEDILEKSKGSRKAGHTDLYTGLVDSEALKVVKEVILDKRSI